MMGRQRRDQGRLFYEFRLEDRIPENHLLRRMNVFAAAVLGFMMIGQSAFAGSHCRDDCSGAKCHSFAACADKLGFSYFCGNDGGVMVNRRCPPFVYPNRAPRDFWMMH